MAKHGVNKVILMGNLGQDPEVRYTPNGVAIANLSVATSESWQDKNTGEKKELTEWHRVVLYRRLAEVAGEYLKKGAKVYIEGRLRTRKWQDQNGQDRYTTEIMADEMQMIGGSGNGQQGGQGNQGQQQSAPTGGRNNPPKSRLQQSYQPPASDEPPMDFEDEIPF